MHAMKSISDEAAHLDRKDPLSGLRERFWIPPHGDTGQAYFCGHSLGLQPRAAEAALLAETAAWRERAVGGHFRGDPPWVFYGERLKEDLTSLLGARADEIVSMNTLTVNLHLLMVSFYRPEGRRRKILIENSAFPSDRYAVASQLRWHGFEPEECLLEAGDGNGAIVEEREIERVLEQHRDEVALVLWPGIQYISGQAFDLPRIAAAAHRVGALAGFDLAHAAGNIPLQLHDSGADFAAWCNYKYLNGGPGAIAGAFIHRRHHREKLPRLEGWWGNDAASRFRMAPEFEAAAGADAWQLSTPPLLALAPLRASLDVFREAGMERLRAKSVALTGFLQQAVESQLGRVLEIVTTADPRRRGCQLSLRVRAGREAGRALFEHLEREGIISDWREPDIIRVAPVPLYNRFHDIYRLVRSMRDWAGLERESA